jgi:hypothetical protein
MPKQIQTTFNYRGKVLTLDKTEYRLFIKNTNKSKYHQETKERINRDKERLRKYFTKEELSDKDKFLRALESKFSKKDRRGIDTGRTLREKPDLMWNSLKEEGEVLEYWKYVRRDQKWRISVERDKKGRFVKVRRIEQVAESVGGEEEEVGQSELFSV